MNNIIESIRESIGYFSRKFFSEDFLKSKTTISAIAIIVGVFHSWQAGSVNTAQALQIVATSIFAMFIRDTIRKGQEWADDHGAAHEEWLVAIEKSLKSIAVPITEANQQHLQHRSIIAEDLKATIAEMIVDFIASSNKELKNKIDETEKQHNDSANFTDLTAASSHEHTRQDAEKGYSHQDAVLKNSSQSGQDGRTEMRLPNIDNGEDDDDYLVEDFGGEG